MILMVTLSILIVNGPHLIAFGPVAPSHSMRAAPLSADATR
jgi:hypothetical protein